MTKDNSVCRLLKFYKFTEHLFASTDQKEFLVSSLTKQVFLIKSIGRTFIENATGGAWRTLPAPIAMNFSLRRIPFKKCPRVPPLSWPVIHLSSPPRGCGLHHHHNQKKHYSSLSKHVVPL